jgi:ketosteroid isomerase-like protein
MNDDLHDPRLEQVLAFEDRRRAAIVARDLDALDSLLAPDLAYVHSNGMVDTKDEYIGIVKAHTFNSIDHEFITTRVHDDLAIFTAITTIDARKDDDGTVLAGQIRTVNIWERTGDAWQQIHWQASKAKVDA